MAKRFLSLVLCMMLVVPTGILRAEETEITLFETILIGYVGGDDPMDDPELPGSIDPPTRFRASISQRILSVTSLVSAGAATIAVFDHHGESASDWNTGDYTIYISSIGYTYQGYFEIY